MNEWGVVGVIVVLVGLIGAVVGPMIKVSSSLTKISTILDSVLSRVNKLEEADKDLQETARQGRGRLHERIDEVNAQVQNHEVRITAIETSGGASHAN